MDNFDQHAAGLDTPIELASAVVPNDAADLEVATRAIFVGAGGNLRVTLVRGDPVTFTNIEPGWHPLRVKRVWATGTTAAEIVGCS